MSISSIPAKLQAEAAEAANDNPGESPISRVIGLEIADLKSLALWRGAFGECVGCALLGMFTIGVGLKKEGEEGPPLLQVAIGCGFFLAVIITVLGNVSGGHVNPAISIGFFLTGQITFVRFIVYSIFQVVGVAGGAAILKGIIPANYIGNLGLISPGPGITDLQAFGSEGVITFLLLFGTLAMVDNGRKDVQGSIPMMVGFIVAVNILWGANISGGCMNPARNFGPAIVEGNFHRIWIYWAGPMAGGAVGALTYDLLFAVRPFGLKRYCLGANENLDFDLEKKDDAYEKLLHKQLDSSPESNV